MPDFVKGPNWNTPFGKNVYLRSTRGLRTISRMVAADLVTAHTIDNWAGQKMLQPGTVMAKVTSGDDVGAIGPYQPASGDATLALAITGTPTGGTFTLTLAGDTTAAIVHNPLSSDIQIALEALENVSPDGEDLTVTGSGTSFSVVFTAGGRYDGVTPTLSATSSLTGGSSPAVGVSTSTAGGTSSGATDGRQDALNIVGINDTFLPWQLMRRNVEVAIVVDCLAVKANCLMYDHSGNDVALDDATADAIEGDRHLAIRFERTLSA